MGSWHFKLQKCTPPVGGSRNAVAMGARAERFFRREKVAVTSECNIGVNRRVVGPPPWVILGWFTVLTPRPHATHTHHKYYTRTPRHLCCGVCLKCGFNMC